MGQPESDKPLASKGELMANAEGDKVICPNCCHQFRAIPVDVQAALASKRKLLAECRDLAEWVADGLIITEVKAIQGRVILKRIDAILLTPDGDADTVHKPDAPTAREMFDAAIDAARKDKP